MEFIYRLTCNCGWAEIEFSHENFSRTYAVENCLGDNLIELLGGMVALSGFRRDYMPFCEIADHICKDPDNDFSWTVADRGTSTKFIFNINESNNTINLKIIEQFYNDMNENCVFDKDINLDELIDSLLSSYGHILKNYGIIGYYENFWEEFPISFYLLLKDYREHKFNYNIFVEENIEGKLQSMFKIDIFTELEYLRPKE